MIISTFLGDAFTGKNISQITYMHKGRANSLFNISF